MIKFVIQKSKRICLALAIFCIYIFMNGNVMAQPVALQYETIELSFTSNVRYTNPYTHADVRVQFINKSNDTLWRPAFWDDLT